MTTATRRLSDDRGAGMVTAELSMAMSAALPLRVLQVVGSLNPGGTERLVIEIARRLNPEIPMAVCCLDEPGTWANELEREGVPVSAIRRSAGFQPGVGRSVAAAASAHRADVIHCHQYSPFIYSCLARAWNPRLRVVFTEHGRLTDSLPSAKRRIANQVFRRVADRVFTVSDELRRHVVAEGFASRSVGVIYNGIAVGAGADLALRDEIRRELGVDRETLVVGTIARLDPVKDLGTLIEAIARQGPSTRIVLVIVGDGPERATLEAAAREHQVADRVRFLGHRDDARKWLHGCDVYVNCSVSEGVSLTILEAMAAGLPIVATAVGGTPEVVVETCGRLVTPRNATELASRLMELAAAEGLRQELGRAARQRVMQAFSIEHMVERYRTTYYEVA